MNEKNMNLAFQTGVKDAENAISKKHNVDDLIHYHALKKSGNH